jgi:hypothetical protein
LLRLSSRTISSCNLLPDLVVLPIKQIVSVVAMIPHRPTLPSGIAEDQYFMVEKLGLDLALGLGLSESDGLDEEDEMDE